MDERTPKKIKSVALKMRDADTFFDTSDKFIRQTLLKLYPQLLGVEATVLRKEIHNPPSMAILQTRKKNFVMLGERFGENTTIEKYAREHQMFKFNFEIPNSKSIDFLKGQVACRGIVHGKVRVLKRKEQISDIKKGEIIVSPMTTPDYLPAMKKAIAFITDEGGVTCHAAIVAREMNKPCIIGTKIATQVLKDGMEVEVDANKGIVKILNKS